MCSQAHELKQFRVFALRHAAERTPWRRLTAELTYTHTPTTTHSHTHTRSHPHTIAHTQWHNHDVESFTTKLCAVWSRNSDDISVHTHQHAHPWECESRDALVTGSLSRCRCLNIVWASFIRECCRELRDYWLTPILPMGIALHMKDF